MRRTTSSVFLPDAPGGPVELNLGLSRATIDFPFVVGNTLVVPVEEERQGEDLDGDGLVGAPPGFDFEVHGVHQVFHTFNANTQRVTNFRTLVTIDKPEFIDRGLVFLSPTGRTQVRRFPP